MRSSGVGPAQVVDTAVECFKNWRVIRLKRENWGQNTILPNILRMIISSTTILFFIITNMKEKVYLDSTIPSYYFDQRESHPLRWGSCIRFYRMMKRRLIALFVSSMKAVKITDTLMISFSNKNPQSVRKNIVESRIN